jgi:hypothetical protein
MSNTSRKPTRSWCRSTTGRCCPRAAKSSGLFSSVLTAVPAYFVWRTWTGDELALLALVGILGAVGQFCQVSAHAAGELMAIAPIDYSRLIFAGIMGFLLFAELPDRYTLVGAAIIVGSTLYIAYRETQMSRMHRAALAARPDRAPSFRPSPTPCDQTVSVGIREGRKRVRDI